MITNLVASVITFLSTNTVEQVTAWERTELVSKSCPDGVMGCLVFHGDWVKTGPKEKTITTNVTKTTRLSFDWMGEHRVVDVTELVWSTNKVLRLDWR